MKLKALTAAVLAAALLSACGSSAASLLHRSGYFQRNRCQRR